MSCQERTEIKVHLGKGNKSDRYVEPPGLSFKVDSYDYGIDLPLDISPEQINFIKEQIARLIPCIILNTRRLAVNELQTNLRSLLGIKWQ